MANREISFWRPNNTDASKGAVAFLESNERGVFLSFLPQGGTDGKKFNREGRINAKLGLPDLGEFLCVLNGRKEGLGTKGEKGFSGLIHKMKGSEDSSIIGLSPYKDRYYLSLSVKRGNDSKRLSVGLGDGDMEILREFIRAVVVDLMAKEQAPQEEQNV